MSLLVRAGHVLRQQGVLVLLMKTMRFVLVRLYRRLERSYYNSRGKQQLSIDSTSATFASTVEDGGPLLRESYRKERSLISEVLSDLESDDVFWDVGANLGLFAGFAGQVIQEGTVIAIEPHKKSASQLSINLSYNSSDYEVIQCALSDAGGTVELEYRYHDRETIGAKSATIARNQSSETRTVDAISGDQLIACGRAPVPNVVKMDIEGAEAVALSGMSSTLVDESCRLLFLEVHLEGSSTSIQEFGMDYDTVVGLLHSYGFELRELERFKTRVHIKAIK